ncbi:bifunctional folylpolyglutamate synthase/dihydrofolate synthase [Salisediminibacterium halotolerans]|uniref:bifunctional folylpolyglutamate synthase/dihydrofolate synthase n=1 Tax=Salisediminibacterium halotolerans TaxID=517425 RepID=UPI000F0F2FAD|nr:cyanophycin synthetase [Salisediminibacterium halotolerans]RLJ78237.1 dihydrofolate synthase/folylpolyglutamate synthase [Actinophytocola xinjiangensis]TWG37214.1 dihydrofolate synthase/folylpolyglutamate synthase [Salisediminibacterium halotolerans]
MTVMEASDWLQERQAAGISYSLDRIEAVLDRIDRPDNKLSVIHIAGTNGKGTVGQYLSNVLIMNGLRVGSFETPSFGEVWEQLQYNGKGIDSSQFAEALSSIASEIEKVENVRNELVSPFEVMTALAYYMFAHVLPTDAVIIEAGMGGRLDATNAVKRPKATVITNVDFDHEVYLGSALADIAFEKAGIIKNSAPVFTGATEPALSVIAETAASKGTYLVEPETFKPSSWNEEIIAPVDRINAALAAETACYMLAHVYAVMPTETEVRRAILATSLPGRMETMQQNPTVIVDTAHNPAAITALTEKLTHADSFRFVYVLFAAMKDKNYQEMLAVLNEAKFNKQVFWCSFHDYRAAEPNDYEAREVNAAVGSGDSKELLTKLLREAKREDAVLITGSHAFVSYMRNVWKN